MLYQIRLFLSEWFNTIWDFILSHPEVVWSGIGTSIFVFLISLVPRGYNFFRSQSQLDSSKKDSLSELHQRGWPDSASRSDLIERLLSDVSYRLASSLHEDVAISLKMDLQLSQVSPSLKIASIGKKPNRLLPSGSTIKDVFYMHEIQGKLLILGLPGAGKTTTLLELTKYLLEKKPKDPVASVPVIFECSTWTGEPIDVWLAKQMKILYKISTQVGLKLIEKGSVIPLLDGLDELQTLQQAFFIPLLNKFQKHLKHIVICSRIEEYQHLEVPLELNNAIYLEPLSCEMIFEYLHRLNCRALRCILTKYPTLLFLVQTPLFLSMMILCYSSLSTNILQADTTEKEYREHLFNIFLKQRLGNQSFQQKLTWLTWLSRLLKNRFHTEFAIESLQPAQLTNPQRFGPTVAFACGLFFGGTLMLTMIMTATLDLAFGGTFGVAEVIFQGFEQQETQAETLFVALAGGLFAVLFVGLVFGLVSWLSSELYFSFLKKNVLCINPIEVIRMPQLSSKENVLAVFNKIVLRMKDRLVDGFKLGVVIGLSVGLTYGLLGGLFDEFNEGLWIGLFFWGGGWLTFWLIRGLAGGLEILKQPLLKKKLVNQGIRNSMLNGFIFASLAFFLTTAILFNGINLLVAVYLSFIFSFIIFLYTGGLAYLQHYCLRLLLWRQKSIPFQYAQFLNEMADQKILQRVGGNFRFLHFMMRDHIASCAWKNME